MAKRESRTEYLKVRLTKSEYDNLQSVCAAEGVTVSAMVMQRVQEMSIPVSEPGDWE